MRISVRFRLAGAALLALLPAAARSAEPEWAARYHVRFGSTAAGVAQAHVEGTLRWIGKAAARPASVEVGMADDGFPKGYGAFVRSFAATGLETREASVVPSTGRHRLRVSPRGTAAFSYAVVLDHDPTGWGPGPDEAPYRFAEGALWTGRALFVTAAQSRVEVTFKAPRGDRVLTSFEPMAGGGARAFRVPDEERLRDCFLVVGRPASADLKLGRATVTLVLGGALKESLPLLKEATGRFLAASSALFGGAPPHRILVVGNVGGPKGSFNGGTYGDDVSFLLDEPLGAANARRFWPFLCHEVFHLWNGRALDYEGQQYWISEGFTDYYARALLVRLGDLSGGDFLADLQRRMARYLASRPETGLRQAGDAKFDNMALVYDGGSLAALSLDLRIRAATSNQRSLDDVMKALYAEFAGAPLRRATEADVIRTISAVAGVPFDDFFARYIAGHEALPLSASMSLAGVEVAASDREIPELGWVTRQLLRCPSMTALPGVGLRVLKSQGESLRDGDVITEVAGAPTTTFDDLRMASADLAPGATVAIGLVRDGKPIAVEVTLGGDPASPPPRSRFVSVSLKVIEDPGAAALAIRTSIFGPGL